MKETLQKLRDKWREWKQTGKNGLMVLISKSKRWHFLIGMGIILILAAISYFVGK